MRSVSLSLDETATIIASLQILLDTFIVADRGNSPHVKQIKDIIDKLQGRENEPHRI